MGCEHDTLYDFCDVAEKKVKIRDAVYTKNAGYKKNSYEIDVLRSPLSYGDISEESVGAFAEEAKSIYDFVIFDCPSGKFELFEILAKAVDLILVVTLHSAASIRSAEKLAAYLSETTGGSGENVRLVINGFNPGGIARGLNLGIVDIIERSKIRLVGLIGTNDQIRDLQEEGKTVYDIKNKKIRKAFDDIAGRILDNNIILSRKYDGFKIDDLYFKKEK
jgi:septum formation inhibitor-activating ATPase MinD